MIPGIRLQYFPVPSAGWVLMRLVHLLRVNYTFEEIQQVAFGVFVNRYETHRVRCNKVSYRGFLFIICPHRLINKTMNGNIAMN